MIQRPTLTAVLLREYLTSALLTLALCSAVPEGGAFAESLSTALHAESPQVRSATLFTTRGDSLLGHWQPSADPEHIWWHVNGLNEPLKFSTSHVASITFPTGPEPTTSRQGATLFYCELVNGDRLLGTPIAFEKNHLVFRDEVTGEIHIDRAAIVRLSKRGAEDQVVFATTGQMSDWTSADKDWRAIRGGYEAYTGGARLSVQLDMPARALVELDLSWRKKPDFQFLISSNDKDKYGIQIERWVDHLAVIAQDETAADVRRICKLDGKSEALRVQLYVDYDQHRLVVRTLDGDLKELALPESLVGGTISIVDRQGGLRCENLRVVRWGGATPDGQRHHRVQIHTTEKETLSGNHLSWNRNDAQLTLHSTKDDPDAADNPSNVHQLSIEDIRSIDFDARAVRANHGMRAMSWDGTTLHGEMLRVTQHRAWLRHPYIVESLPLPLDQLLNVTFLAPSVTPHLPTPLLRVGASTVYGKLVDARAEGDSSCLRWRPQMALNAASVLNDASGEIVFQPKQPKKNKTAKPKSVSPAQLAVRRRVVVHPTTPPPKSETKNKFTDPTIYLAVGDALEANVSSIDSRGVTFASAATPTTFVGHEDIKAVTLISDFQPAPLTQRQLERLLTLPRMQREYPPTHLIISKSGDVIRGRLSALDEDTVTVELRLTPRKIARSQVAAIVWLDREPDGESPNAGPSASDDVPAEDNQSSLQVQAISKQDVRVTMRPHQLQDDTLRGVSMVLGPRDVKIKETRKLLFGSAITRHVNETAQHPLLLRSAIEPRFVSESGDEPRSLGQESELVGNPAPAIKLNMLDDSSFRLSDYEGRILVLDFWASWCGPCMQWMPQLDEMLEEFENVALVTINLSEDKETIEKTLERIKLQPAVAMDIDGVAADLYQATAIPQTVVINTEGIVDRVFIGGGSQVKKPLQQALRQLVGGAE